MATTVVYPYSKINVGLHVLGKRADGYHDIETLFVPHKLCDILEISDARGKDGTSACLCTDCRYRVLNQKTFA